MRKYAMMPAVVMAVAVVMAMGAGAARVYHVPEGAALSDDFKVTVDGAPAPLYRTRVSRIPYNRCWPGRQRPLDQTELASFALFESKGQARITAVPKRVFTNVVVRPLSAGVKPMVKDGGISFTLPKPGFYTLELDGKHKALHIFCDPPDTVQNPVSGRVRRFGPGVHDVGLIELKSGETLLIDEGAVVYGRIYAKDADNIRVIGRGVLDASKVNEDPVDISPADAAKFISKHFEVPSKRHDAIQFVHCDNAEIGGIVINDSPQYNVRAVCCDNLRVHNVKIIGSWRYNTDGIDMHNCVNARVSDCFLRTFDDSVCVKGYPKTIPFDENELREDPALRNVARGITVERCVIWNDWGKCLEIGAGTRAREISDILFHDCDLINISAIGISEYVVDYANVRNVRYEDIRLEYPAVSPCLRYQESDAEPYSPGECLPDTISLVVARHAQWTRSKAAPGSIDGVTFGNIDITAPRMPRVWVAGYDQAHQTRNVSFRGVTLNGRPIGTAEEVRLGTNTFTRDITVSGGDQ